MLLIPYLLAQECGVYLLLFLTYYIHEVPTKHSREKIWTHEIRTERNFGPTKHPRENNFGPTKHPREKIRTHEIPMRKNFGPTKGTTARDSRDLRLHETHGI